MELSDYRRWLQPLWGLLLFLLSSVLPATPTDDYEAFIFGWSAYDVGNYHEALRIWTPLARRGNTEAQVNLGVIYDYGKGVGKNPRQAASWYQAAAEHGHASGQYNLAQLLSQGRGVRENRGEALFWYKKAAEQGLAIAQHKLATLYAEGNGVPTDPMTAIRWYHQAGLSFMEHGETDRAREALEAIQKLSAEHVLAVDLANRLESKTAKSEQNTSITTDISVSAGTAWPIAEGYVITNNHVVANADRVTLIHLSGEKISATVTHRDETNDIALLSVKDTASLPPALPLSINSARLGASVFTIGYPRLDVMGDSPKLTNGIISSINGMYGDTSTYQISVPVQPGNSGGPLLNMNGEVVGVVTSMLGSTNPDNGDTTLLPNISYALKIDVVKNLLQRLPKRRHGLKELSHDSGTLESLADRIQKSVMIIMSQPAATN